MNQVDSSITNIKIEENDESPENKFDNYEI